MTTTAGPPKLENVAQAFAHKPNWASPEYVAWRLKLVVDELRRLPTLEELDELGRFKNPNIKGRSGFTDIAEAIRTYGYDLNTLYGSFGGAGYIARKEVEFPAPHQLEAVVMFGEKKRMLDYDDFRTGKTGIGIIQKPYLEMNVLNQMTQEQEQLWAEISAMPLSPERQQLEELLYHDVAKEKAPTLVIVPSSVKASWRQKIEGYLSIPQTVVTVYSDAIVVDRTRTGQQSVLRGNRLSNLKAALAQSPDYVIVSYDMVFRATADMADPESREAVQRKYEKYKAQITDNAAAQAKLVEIAGARRANAMAKTSPDLETLLRKLAVSEVREESEHIFQVLNEHGFKVLTADEVDNARNLSALRTRAIKEISSSTEYFLPMSGYPAPNKVIRDLSQLAAMIDPEHYDPERFPETAVSFGTTYANHPELVRNFVLMHSKPPTTAEDIGINQAEVVETDAVIELEGIHSEVYEAIRRNREIDLNQKLILLRFALLDPTLMHPKYYPGKQSMVDRLEEIFGDKPQLLAQLEAARKARVQGASSTYNALDEIVLKAVRQGDKFVAFTTLKEGITDELVQRYEAMGLRVWKIDGDIDAGSDEYLSDREKIRLDFQTNPETHGVVANSVMRAGISMDAANVLVTLDRTFEPGPDRQLKARVQGRYQTKPVQIYHITPANTIARGIQTMLMDKDLDNQFVFRGHELTPEQKRRLEERSFTRHPSIIESINPQDLLMSYLRRMHGRGFQANLDFITANNGLVAQRYAESSEYDWEHSYSAQTNRLILRVIELLARSGQVALDSILDAPSGNFALARTILGESKLQFGRIVNLDFNRFQLQYGEKAAGKLADRASAKGGKLKALDLESVIGLMHDLSFAADGQFNLSVCSLGMHYAATRTSIDAIVDGQNNRITTTHLRERELVARGLVRVTRKNGYIILTMPTSAVDDEGAALTTDAMRQLGVDAVPELTGFVRATEPHDSTYESYLWVGRKREFRADARLREDAFMLNVTASYSHPSRRNGNGKPTASPFSDEVCTEFEFKREQKPVEERAMDYIRRIGYTRNVLRGEQFEELRHRVNEQTSQLGTGLKAQILEALDIIEADPGRLLGQRNRLQQLTAQARQRTFPVAIRNSFDAFLAELERI